ncbi:MAG: hypothetical protein M1834_003553 [Cirrosporium novae-zelandiae]|nr:MAG: hypothetical protein M1834_003553 [Cirrosporium novae-zelandiae]
MRTNNIHLRSKANALFRNSLTFSSTPRRPQRPPGREREAEDGANSGFIIQRVGVDSSLRYKDVGLGFRTPKTAIEGTYIDKKCPFVGEISIRGRILSGKVVSTKMHRTLVIRREYLHYIDKYSRYEKRHKNLAAHVSPAFRVEEGDIVTVGQCRPLSKTVRFNVLRVLPRTGKAVKAFQKF